ncbi:hypothetical protein VP02_18420 [Pseudomonas ogarae]|uniref:Uncharacterized protein n=1 Tax=Pseudomonas kilonensis TaxID=132476 RepID=A0A0F4XKR4_9PSED|nr:hypothetical protein VP02_18420 [Pseudomonas ogarae]
MLLTLREKQVGVLEDAAFDLPLDFSSQARPVVKPRGGVLSRRQYVDQPIQRVVAISAEELDSVHDFALRLRIALLYQVMLAHLFGTV